MNISINDHIVLEDSRVKLLPMSLDSVEELRSVGSENPDLLKFSLGRVHTVEQLTDHVRESLAEREAGIRYPFVVFDKKTQEFAGSTSFGAISNAHKRIEIGWTWYAKRFQRTGLNRHCKFLLLKYVFETLQFERVELKTDARNAASRMAMEKIGATFEGALRNHTIMPDGFRRDTCYFSILKEEWPDIKSTIFAGFEG